MEYVYATLMLNETGEEINETNLTATLEAAGASVVQSRVKALVAALEEVDVAELAKQEDLGIDETTAGDGDGQSDQSNADGNPPAGSTADTDADEPIEPTVDEPVADESRAGTAEDSNEDEGEVEDR